MLLDIQAATYPARGITARVSTGAAVRRRATGKRMEPEASARDRTTGGEKQNIARASRAAPGKTQCENAMKKAGGRS